MHAVRAMRNGDVVPLHLFHAEHFDVTCDHQVAGLLFIHAAKQLLAPDARVARLDERRRAAWLRARRG